MNEKRNEQTKDHKCRRCRKEIWIEWGTRSSMTRAAAVLGICKDCAEELRAWMNGGAVLEWHPVKVRELTDEDREELTELGYRPDQIEEVTYLDGILPEDGQEILITCKGYNGRPVVCNDTATVDGRDYWLDSGRDWEDVTGWARWPDPFIPDEEEAKA